MKYWFSVICMILLIGGKPELKVRKPVDAVGFATNPRQMDSVMNRILRLQGQKITGSWKSNKISGFTSWKVAICPHDDYTYAGWLYPAVLKNVKARTVILIGVAHKAKKFGLEDKMIFDSFDRWTEPYGPVRISALREKIMNLLPPSTWLVHDSLQQAEHSVEALVPFLQYYNRDVEIVPILVPYMSYNRMEELSSSLSLALWKVIRQEELTWDRDIAIVISSDAVHYGDQDWGGSDYAPYGCDSSGYKQALAHEHEIIHNCLLGELQKARIRKFTGYTVQDTNFRTYKWTWCGRYSVPFGLLTAFHLEQHLRSKPVKGTLVGYGNSIMQQAIPVEDLKMGKTATAGLHHWVGYTSIGYK